MQKFPRIMHLCGRKIVIRGCLSRNFSHKKDTLATPEKASPSSKKRNKSPYFLLYDESVSILRPKGLEKLWRWLAGGNRYVTDRTNQSHRPFSLQVRQTTMARCRRFNRHSSFMTKASKLFVAVTTCSTQTVNQNANGALGGSKSTLKEHPAVWPLSCNGIG